MRVAFSVTWEAGFWFLAALHVMSGAAFFAGKLPDEPPKYHAYTLKEDACGVAGVVCIGAAIVCIVYALLALRVAA